MEQIPQIARQRLSALGAASAHPEANLLAAFTEKSLGGDERDRVLEHLAQCTECREIVSLATPQEELSQAVAAPARVKSGLFSWPVLRWGTVAACVVVVSAAVMLRHQKTGSQEISSDASVATRQTASPPAAVQEKYAPVPASSSDVQLTARLQEQESKRDSDKRLGVTAKAERSKKGTTAQPDQAPTGLAAGGAVGEMVAVSPVPTAPARAQLPHEMQGNAENRMISNERADKTALRDEKNVAFDGASADSANKDKITVTQQVTVEAAAVQIQTNAVPPKAELLKQNLSNLATNGRNVSALASLTPGVSVPTEPRWTLSPEGKLQRSFDAGKSWQAVSLPGKAKFRALAALGPQIWVGGSRGALYHSTDAGQHWTQVTPVADGKALNTDIISLEFTTPLAGKLTTKGRDIWTTTDGGQSWQKK